MKRRARLFRFLWLISILLAGSCLRATEPFKMNPAIRLYVPEIQEIIKRGVMTVAVVANDNPPFHMLNEKGELIGFDADLARDIAQELGVKVIFNRSAKTFDEVVDLVAKREADLGISKLSFTLERSKKVLYSIPYAILRKAMLINRLKYAQIKKERKADTLEELFSEKDATISAMNKSSYIPFAQKLFSRAHLKPLNRWEEDILREVLAGTIVAAFRDELETKKFLLKHPEANLQLLSVILKDQEDPIRMVASLDKKNLLNWVNGFIASGGYLASADKLLNQSGPYYRYTIKAFSENQSKSIEMEKKNEN